jgi:CHAT domain-containing protein
MIRSAICRLVAAGLALLCLSVSSPATAQDGDHDPRVPITTAAQAEAFLSGDIGEQMSPLVGDGNISPASARRLAILFRRRLEEAVPFADPSDERIAAQWAAVAVIAMSGGDQRQARSAIDNALAFAPTMTGVSGQTRLMGLLGISCGLHAQDRNREKVIETCGDALRIANSLDDQSAKFEIGTMLAPFDGGAVWREPSMFDAVEENLSGTADTVIAFARVRGALDQDRLEDARRLAQDGVESFQSLIAAPEGRLLERFRRSERDTLSRDHQRSVRVIIASGIALFPLWARTLPTPEERRAALDQMDAAWNTLFGPSGTLSVGGFDPTVDELASIVLQSGWADAASVAAGDGDSERARRYLARSDALVRRWPSVPAHFIGIRFEASTRAAMALFVLGDRDEAHRRLKAMADTADAALRRSAVRISNVAGTSTLDDAANDYSQSLWAFLYTSVYLQRDVDAAFIAAQWIGSNSAGLALREASARQAARTPEATRLLDDRRQTFERLDQLAAQGGLYGNAAQIAQERSRLSDIESRLSRAVPRYRDLLSPLPINIDEAQRSLRDGEALVVYGNYGDLIAFVVLPSGPPVMIPLATTNPELVERTERLRRTLSIEDGALPPDFDFDTAYDLYQRVFERLVPWLGDAKDIFVVNTGALESIPLSVLVQAPVATSGTATERYRAARWLGMDYRFTTLPDVSSLTLVRGNSGVSDTAGLVGFGDPTLAAPLSTMANLDRPVLVTQSGTVPDLDSLRGLPSVPETGRLLTTLASRFQAPPGAVRLGAQATETFVKSASVNGELAQARIVVFATHGIRGSDSMEAGLVLTPPEFVSELDDGFLSASEASELRLNADWVILSACNTASAGRAGGRPLSGLTRAFFLAGARSVLASHWPVEAAATSQLIESTLSLWSAGASRAAALQSAQREMLLHGSSLQAHPVFWGAFVVTGEGY